MPLTGERLVIEPKFYKANELSEIGMPEPKPITSEAEAYLGWKIVNEWYSTRLRARVYALRDDKGRARWGKRGAVHHVAYDMSTLSCSDAWGLEQESRAMQLLGTMIRHRQMKQYVLTGMFPERSLRSGVTYIFRRLKPTIAIAPSRDGMDEESMRILACLCMHPIAHYAGSWAGGMCPTDDVIAHLSLMRGDEHLYWRRANQHPPYLPEAGL